MNSLNRVILLAIVCMLIASCSPTSRGLDDGSAMPTSTPASTSSASLSSAAASDDPVAPPTSTPLPPTVTPPTPTQGAPVVLSAGDVRRIGVADARALADSGAGQLYDVRSLEQYRALHAAGALPFPETEMAARFAELPSDAWLIFY